MPFMTKRNLQDAIQGYQQALELNPDLFETILMLGKCNKKLGLISESLHYFELAVPTVKTRTIFLVSVLKLAALGLGAMPAKTPANFMKEFYRKRSDTWDASERYNGHNLIKEAFTQTCKTDDLQLKILVPWLWHRKFSMFLRPYLKH